MAAFLLQVKRYLCTSAWPGHQWGTHYRLLL